MNVGIHTPRTCQVCGEVFASNTEKGIHATLAHDLGRGGTDTVRKFRPCECCSDYVYIGMTCTRGTLAVAS